TPLRLLPGHRDADGLLGTDHVVLVVGGLFDGELHALDLAVKGVAGRTIVGRNGRARVLADVETVIGREDGGQCRLDDAFTDLGSIDVEGHLAALAWAAAVVGEFHAHLVVARRNRRGSLDDEVLEPAPVVAIPELALLGVQTPAADVGALRDDDALG